MTVEQQEDGSVVANLAWVLPEGSRLSHFAVTVEAWDRRPSETDLPDIVFTDIATVAPEDDPTVILCE